MKPSGVGQKTKTENWEKRKQSNLTQTSILELSDGEKQFLDSKIGNSEKVYIAINSGVDCGREIKVRLKRK